jgi:hypothetical protein
MRRLAARIGFGAAMISAPFVPGPSAARAPDDAAAPSSGGLNNSGVTGYFSIPTAQTLPEGSLAAAFATTPGQERRFDGAQRTAAAAGLFGFLEVSGQLNAADGPHGLRDLSLGAKMRLPGIPARFPQLAVGVDDFGGEASNFRSRYVVGTYHWQPLSFTAGYGTGPDRLKGVFGGVQGHLPFGLALGIEHDGRDDFTSLRWVSPVWRSLQTSATVAYDWDQQSRTYFSVGLRVC